MSLFLLIKSNRKEDKMNTTTKEKEQEYHTFVYDENQIIEFGKLFLPQLQSDSPLNDKCLILFLMARKKYLKEEVHIFENLRKVSLPRKIITSLDPKQLAREIRRMECNKLGFTIYGGSNNKEEKEKQKDIILPTNALIVYMDVQPKSALKALNKLHEQAINEVLHLSLKEEQEEEEKQKDKKNKSNNKQEKIKFNRLYSEYLGKIHTTNSNDPTSLYSIGDVDVDTKDKDLLKHLYYESGLITFDSLSSVPTVRPLHNLENILAVVETKNGFHILFNKKNMKYRLTTLYQFCKRPEFSYMKENNPEKQTYFAINSAAMVPVPGCIQAGFPVKLFTPEEFITYIFPSS